MCIVNVISCVTGRCVSPCVFSQVRFQENSLLDRALFSLLSQMAMCGQSRIGKAGKGAAARRFVGTARAIAQEFPSEHSGVIPRVAADIKTPCHFVLCVTKWPKQGSSRQMTWCDLTQRTPSNRNIPAKHLWRPSPQPLQHLILACPSIHRLRME